MTLNKDQVEPNKLVGWWKYETLWDMVIRRKTFYFTNGYSKFAYRIDRKGLTPRDFEPNKKERE